MKAFSFYAILFALMCSSVATAQAVRPISIDLATQKPGSTIKEDLTETAVLQLSVINMIPSAGRVSYEISVVQSDADGTNPLTIIDYVPPKILPATLRSNDSDECSIAFNSSLDLLLHLTKETNVPGVLSDAQTQLDEKCSTTSNAMYDKLEQLTVAQDVMVKMLEYGKKMTITIKRSGTMWRYELSVINKKSFYFYYGLSFSPNLMTPVPTFFCQSDATGEFVITRRRQENDWSYRDALPTIFYTWVPRNTFYFLSKRIRRKLTFGAKVRNAIGIMLSNNVYRVGLTGGVHTDLLKPKVMFSPTFVIGKNLTLSAGVCFMQKSTLRGEYQEGQVVREFLDFDALHENIYYSEWFFAVGFRIDHHVLADLFSKGD
jgi:hypothetical protein